MQAHAASTKRNRANALAKAVRRAGSQVALAKAIDRRQASVWDWLNAKSDIPAGDAIKIERVSGVPAELLNSDLLEFAELRGLDVRSAP